MARKRLISCDFINSGSFSKLSNKAKLLYTFIFTNADDKGFCDNAEILIDNLNCAENISNDNLLEDNYKVALQELIDKGLLFKFVGKHNNSVYLVRHWYYHNNFKKDLYTQYYKYLKKVELEENKYELRKKETIIKEENKINENKLNENKTIAEIIGDNDNNKEEDRNDPDWTPF